MMRGTLPADSVPGKAYAAVQKRIAARRERRRKMKALEAVTDPEKAARARLAKAEEKRSAARKRKIQEYRARERVFSEHEEARSRGVTAYVVNSFHGSVHNKT